MAGDDFFAGADCQEHGARSRTQRRTWYGLLLNTGYHGSGHFSQAGSGHVSQAESGQDDPTWPMRFENLLAREISSTS